MTTRNLYKAACYGILINSKNEILWLQYSATSWAPLQFTLPAGHIEKGETPTQTIIREIKEEVGVDINPQSISHILTNLDAQDDYFDIFFVISQWSGTPKISEPHKHISLVWADSQNPPFNSIPKITQAVTAALNKISFTQISSDQP